MMTYTPIHKQNKILAGYVYVIKDETDGRKLGFSQNPDIRVKQLQTGNKETLYIEYRLEVKDMRKAESSLHTLFAAYRLQTKEWFHLTETDLVLLKKIFRVVQTTEREESLLKSLGLRQ